MCSNWKAQILPIPRAPIPRLRRNVAGAAGKEGRGRRREAVRKGGTFMPGAGLERLAKARRAKAGKGRCILGSRVRRQEGMRCVSREMATSRSTVRGRLPRVHSTRQKEWKNSG